MQSRRPSRCATCLQTSYLGHPWPPGREGRHSAECKARVSELSAASMFPVAHLSRLLYVVFVFFSGCNAQISCLLLEIYFHVTVMDKGIVCGPVERFMVCNERHGTDKSRNGLSEVTAPRWHRRSDQLAAESIVPLLTRLCSTVTVTSTRAMVRSARP